MLRLIIYVYVIFLSARWSHGRLDVSNNCLRSLAGIEGLVALEEVGGIYCNEPCTV